MVDQSKVRDQIANAHADGEPLASILRQHKVKLTTYKHWLKTIPDFAETMQEAQEAHVESKLADLNDALDRFPNPQAAKVFSDNLRWQLSKLDPDRFGDRLNVDHRHTHDLTSAFRAALSRLQATHARPSATLELTKPDNSKAYALQPFDSQSVTPPSNSSDP